MKVSHVRGFQVVKFIDTEEHASCQKLGVAGSRMLFNGYRTSILQNGKTSVDSGDGYTK